MTKSLHIIVLAAGQGTRMHSQLPKVLQRLADRSLLEHVVNTARELKPARIHVVYGHGGDEVRRQLAHLDVDWILQAEQLGTAHAVSQAIPQIPDEAAVLVLYGDVPLITASTLRSLLAAAGDEGLALLTAILPDPTGYGRVLRNLTGSVRGIVEDKDASPEERRINEVNTGFIACHAAHLRQWLGRVGRENTQGEYYLTDVVALAAEGVGAAGIQALSAQEVMGVNDRAQLAEAERVFQLLQARRLMRAGLGLRDPARFDLRGELGFGRDTIIDVNVVLEGKVSLGSNVTIATGCYLRDCEVGDGSEILPHSVLEGARIGARCHVGPFARMRPGTVLDAGAKVGNFVETKNTHLGEGAKANHLSYVGDTEVGRNANIGAGVITCNYDGANKHKTVIGEGAFIGSDVQLVAPVEIGARATIGAGSTITRNAPADKLTVSRVKQQVIEGWKRPEKKPGEKK